MNRSVNFCTYHLTPLTTRSLCRPSQFRRSLRYWTSSTRTSGRTGYLVREYSHIKPDDISAPIDIRLLQATILNITVCLLLQLLPDSWGSCLPWAFRPWG